MPTAQGLGPHGEKHEAEFESTPDNCPLCHHGVQANKTGVTSFTGDPASEYTALEIVFRCPRQQCSRLFVGRYRRQFYRGNASTVFMLRECLPAIITPPHIPKEIGDLSASFAEIFTQAAAAEAYGLDQICGMGYRKALEFLIKDYCISKHPEHREGIETERLAVTIRERVGDGNVKECAHRAAWLGNDETHYVRKWEGKDIRDLKTLIELTMIWVRSEVLTQRYV